MTRRMFWHRAVTLWSAGTMASATGSAHDDEPLQLIREKLRLGQPLTLASIGDSITWICFHTDARRNYLTFVADALRKKYPKANIRLEQSGNRGSTARAMPFLETLLQVKPDMVFIMFGMNDCKRGTAQLDDYDRNLTELIQRVRKAEAVPVLLTQNEIVYPAEGREALPQYVARAVAVSQRENVLLVDNFSDWHDLQKEEPDTWKLYLNDVMHPNLTGHRRFAKAVLKRLWPEADELHDSGLWPLAGKLPRPVECLVSGPPDKQMLRIGPTTWVTLTGRRRGAEVTDLVLSVAEKANPTWHDFRHVTLVGTEPDAVFPWGERNINSAMLLRSGQRIFILFSHVVRRSLLVLDCSREGWSKRLHERSTYQSLSASNVPLPEAVGGSYSNDTEFVDGYVDNGYPAFFYREGLSGKDEGIQWANLGKEKTELVFPNYSTARGDFAGSEWIAVGQTLPGGQLHAARSSAANMPPPLAEATDFSLRGFGKIALFIGLAKGGAWRAARLGGGHWQNIDLPPDARQAENQALVTRDEAAFLLSGNSESVTTHFLDGAEFRKWGKPQAMSSGRAWRYEGHLPAGASVVGILSETNRLSFTTVQLP